MVRFPSVELLEAQELLSTLFDNASVGLAVFDERLCYRIVNPYLASSNCTSIESHLGKHVREILGEVGLQVEPAIQQVFANPKPLLNCEFEGALPTKPYGRWIDNFFPIMGVNGRVTQVGVVVVELGRNVKLETIQTQPLVSPAVLRSWKDIAQYVRASVKTVQRWEQDHQFPVRRVTQNKGAVVFALQEEVDEWLRKRSLSRNPNDYLASHLRLKR